MDGTWNVNFEGRIVGTCRIWREGLYARFSCRCNRVAEDICRLFLCCGEVTVDLGILVPVENGFGLDRRLPLRSLPDESYPEFCIRLPERPLVGKFIPVKEGEAFCALSRLADARFGKKDAAVGVFFA